MTALLAFPALWAERPVREAIERGLRDADAQVRVASIRLALEPRAKIADSALRKALDDPDPPARIALLDRIGSEGRSSATCGCSGVVSNALVAENGGVREKALQLIQKNPATAGQRGDRECACASSPSPQPASQRHREIARALLASRGRSSAGDEHCRPAGPRLLPGTGSCRSSTGWARTARTAWAAIARTRS